MHFVHNLLLLSNANDFRDVRHFILFFWDMRRYQVLSLWCSNVHAVHEIIILILKCLLHIKLCHFNQKVYIILQYTDTTILVES